MPGIGQDLGNNAIGIGGAALNGFANPFLDLNALLGVGQTIAGLSGLNKVPAYQSEQIDPKVVDMLNRSQEMAKQGYSPEEITAFHNSVAQGDTMRFMKGTEAGGGNLAQVVNNSNNVDNSNALNAFSAKDAALKLANQHYADQTVKYYQGLKDKSWAYDNAHISALNNSWGSAAKQGLSTLTGALGAGAAGIGRGGNPSIPSYDPNNPGIGGAANSGGSLSGASSFAPDTYVP